MRKSTLFISAVLTTFVMAMLAGVASAYQGIVSKNQVEALQPTQVPPTTAPVADTIPAEVQPVNFTPDQAAALAAQVMGHNDLYSVEVTDLNGESVYMVTFTSGDLVYVSMDGQIRSIGKVQVETVVVNSGGGGNRNRDKGGSVSQPAPSNQSHEEHEDNQGGEHDD